MLRSKFLWTLGPLLALALGGGDIWAHGGNWRGPNGGVPPALRQPHDPLPPPPPPSDPPPGDTPITPPGQTPGTGFETPGSGGNGTPPIAPNPSSPRRPGATTRKTSFESWRFWWAYNNDDILDLKAHTYARQFYDANPLRFVGSQDVENRRAVRRPTRRLVTSIVIPALLRTIRRKGDNEDVQGGAIVALGKLGSLRHVALFNDVIWNRYRNPAGQAVDFGRQARESGVLALGLLPGVDASGRDTLRAICLRALQDEKLRTRERTWAAVCLGLQRDRKAVKPLLAELRKRYSDDNVPAGILAGLGLIGDEAARAPIEEILTHGAIGKRRTSDRVRAFAGYAIGKIGDPRSLPLVLKVLRSRRQGRIVKRSAAIAAGTLGAGAAPEMRDRTVQALLKYLRRSGGDLSGENFAIISLSRVGTPRAVDALLGFIENGRYGQRPFAALGLGTYVFYRRRAAEQGRGAPLDQALQKRIVDRLARLSRKYKDAETQAAFFLARGLVRDRTAVEELIALVARPGADPVLRGTCCVALGLLGDRRPSVKTALELALRERKSEDLRRSAATGLGLLDDADVVKILLQEMKRARSFAVQGQLIRAIGAIGDQRAIPPLVEILDNPHQPIQTRAMAAVGLGLVGDLEPLPRLGRISKDYNYCASAPDIDELLYIL